MLSAGAVLKLANNLIKHNNLTRSSQPNNIELYVELFPRAFDVQGKIYIIEVLQFSSSITCPRKLNMTVGLPCQLLKADNDIFVEHDGTPIGGFCDCCCIAPRGLSFLCASIAG
jgi:hypothetical protein